MAFEWTWWSSWLFWPIRYLLYAKILGSSHHSLQCHLKGVVALSRAPPRTRNVSRRSGIESDRLHKGACAVQ
ncbi:hypothetical protein P280DRAFT_131531 [Massarina eburnea CBS 473.64]|uniref:Secreted protein n=1 Tax=Massarina eburnea CBS 473.64 TaxID=1395130 RepID=A0A6A6SHH0_9PLEO|nr:hypothetical protein P280DRAFT_131531 [Massarina eburnea CBS 473.64]